LYHAPIFSCYNKGFGVTAYAFRNFL